MEQLLSQIEKGQALIWLDSHDYAAKLFAGGKAPWTRTTDCIAWLRKSNGLLNPSVLVLPLSAVIQAYLNEHPSLQEEMASKSRLVFPAKVLLADEGLRALVVELATGLVSVSGGKPVALSMPSPLAMAQQAYALAHGDADAETFTEDEADSCAAYIADFLRELASSNINGLLLEESSKLAQASATTVASYQAVMNVAKHYRWTLGLDLGASTAWQGDWPDSVDFILSSQEISGGPTGVWMSADFWADSDFQTSEALFTAVHVPADASPERVLERLAVIRDQAVA